MGFEITYHYHERNPEGGYNTEQRKELKRKVGKAFDDTPLSSAAKAILAQLARRDIWVVDVELEELVKRKVSFKESKDGFGILLKGKKFTIEDTEGVQVEEYVEDNGGPVVAAAVRHIQNPQLGDVNFEDNIELTPDQKRRTLFKIIFRPEPQDVAIAKKYKLTAEKKYNVHRQRNNPLGGQFGSVYAITNDAGEIAEVDEKYFIIAPQGLVGGEQFNRDFRQEEQPRLLYQNSSSGVPQRRAVKVDRSQIPEEFAHIPVEGEEDAVMEIPMHNIRPDYVPPKPTRV